MKYSKTFGHEKAVYAKFLSAAKQQYPGLSSEEQAEITRQVMLNFSDTTAKTLKTLAFFSDLDGLSTHIYLENKELSDFLGSMKTVDIQGFSSFIEQRSEFLINFSESKAYVEDREKYTYIYTFCFHKPGEDKGFSLSLFMLKHPFWDHHEEWWDDCDENDNLLDEAERGLGQLILSYSCDEYSAFVAIPRGDFPADEKKRAEDLINNTNFAAGINSLIYIFMYPETLVDSAPELPQHKGAVKLLKVSKHIIDTERDSSVTGSHKTPHFRSGHFRYLNSDFFKNKKGTWVFVKSSVVGHAKLLKNKD